MACVILKNRFILKKIYDEAPTNEGSDGLRHFKKSIHFKEKYMVKRPQMKGRTVCVMLEK